MGNAKPDTDWLPGIRNLIRYWSEKREDHPFPRRNAIDPLDIPNLLSDLWMVDVVYEAGFTEPRFRYRLVGTRVVEELGLDPTGQWVDETFPRFVSSGLRGEAMTTVGTGIPTIYAGPPLMASDPNVFSVQRVSLPLSNDGDDVAILMGLSLFVFKKDQ